MTHSTRIIFAAFVLSLMAIGCSATEHTAQTLDLRITDRESGKPLPGAIVQVVDNHHANAAEAAPTTQPTLAALRHVTRVGTTDSDGSVRILVDTPYKKEMTSALSDETKDRLSGKKRNVLITKGDASETIPVKMKAGTSSPGDTLNVFVKAVGKPMETPRETDATK